MTGFEVPEIDLLLGAEVEETDTDDELPEAVERVVSQPGDLWLLGPYRVLCDDARSEGAFTGLMGERRADVVFTDPRYNVAIDGHASGNGRHRHADFSMASGEMNTADFTMFLKSTLAQLAAWSSDDSVHYVCMDWRHMGELLEAGTAVYSSLLNLRVWAKDNGGMGSFYRSQHELIFVFRPGKGPHRTMCSWASSDATAPTSGSTPERIPCRAQARKAISSPCTRR